MSERDAGQVPGQQARVSLYIGNICDSLPDIVLRQMLSVIGTVQVRNCDRGRRVSCAAVVEPAARAVRQAGRVWVLRVRQPGVVLARAAPAVNRQVRRRAAITRLTARSFDGQTLAVNLDQKNKASLEAYQKGLGRGNDLYTTTDGAIKHADNQIVEQLSELLRETAANVKACARHQEVNTCERTAGAVGRAALGGQRSAASRRDGRARRAGGGEGAQGGPRSRTRPRR